MEIKMKNRMNLNERKRAARDIEVEDMCQVRPCRTINPAGTSRGESSLVAPLCDKIPGVTRLNPNSSE